MLTRRFKAPGHRTGRRAEASRQPERCPRYGRLGRPCNGRLLRTAVNAPGSSKVGSSRLDSSKVVNRHPGARANNPASRAAGNRGKAHPLANTDRWEARGPVMDLSAATGVPEVVAA